MPIPKSRTTSTSASPRAQKDKDVSTSPIQATSPTTPAEDYTSFRDAGETEDTIIEIENDLVTSNMKEEEAKYEEESKRLQEEEDQQLSKQLQKDGFDMKGLEFLLKKSTIYSTILTSRLEESRKAKAERTTKAAAKPVEQKKPVEEETGKENKRATRSGATEKAAEPEAKPAAKKGRGRKAAAPAPVKKQNSILTFFSKEKPEATAAVKDALGAAVEEDKTETFGATATEQLHTRQPKLVTGCVMKEYQLEGLEWMASLFENGLNGILADEMGLGKTLQTISLFAFLREMHVYGPFLVAAPLSTLANWVDEFAKFTPDIPVVLYHGNPQERENLRDTKLRTKNYRNVGPDFPVVCTSYEIIMNDRKYLASYDWKYIVIDEGHRLKNFNCRLVKELEKYPSANRLLLTGTPLQNNLVELWSLLHFLLPQVFNDVESFQSWFDFSDLQQEGKSSEEIKKSMAANLVSSLHQILKPFLLRRMKTDVELSLPKKREYVLYAPLSQTQKELYRRILDKDTEEFLIGKLLEASGANAVAKAMSKKGTKGTETPKRKRGDMEEEDQSSLSVPSKALKNSRSNKKLRVDYKEKSDRQYFKELETTPTQSKETSPELSAEQVAYQAAVREIKAKKMQNPVMQLRLACNSPHLFYWPWGDKDPDETIVTESGKMMLLDRLIPELFNRGHKVLIFSQFKVQLDIIQEWATTLRGWNCCRIDGSVKQEDRRSLIKSFNSDSEHKLFLLSTRAGGLGINLTSADTVILYDSDWNPQQDLQAQDRAHRIGQTRPVIVYRLATAATVEQTLLEKADAKRRLEKLVIQKGKFKSMTATNTKTEEQEFADLRKILMSDDFEKFDVAKEGDEILSNEDLEVLLDRSDEAYEKAAKGETKASGVFKAVEMKKVSEQDILAQM
ncbi:hypothetical protein AOL_s00109g55 [Orbilia oligospora ATCC 24927]|uniref:Uncharacterized protein n=1 Tax=Arthrobotrys oligospora (strain ATCC 24927 / CBS 115.81 / DSM 1491) TaxID=756982 RepID=G1XK26_ARTOA|nr:hypothetical protein AOL_s00109g55 [Orbilia oligospora ATCC 24927]EGX46483.1 hypothetical protein AOL_s00109g55 [Orbilia oligospora ATCC 24927]